MMIIIVAELGYRSIEYKEIKDEDIKRNEGTSSEG